MLSYLQAAFTFFLQGETCDHFNRVCLRFYASTLLFGTQNVKNNQRMPLHNLSVSSKRYHPSAPGFDLNFSMRVGHVT